MRYSSIQYANGVGVLGGVHPLKGKIRGCQCCHRPKGQNVLPQGIEVCSGGSGTASPSVTQTVHIVQHVHDVLSRVLPQTTPELLNKDPFRLCSPEHNNHVYELEVKAFCCHANCEQHKPVCFRWR
eukprot:XP_001709105.1 Hypothetical protein GL50803_20781 [Giardia lamblia ATCC 50803]